MRLFYDIETKELVTEDELYNDYLESEHKGDCSFQQFLRLCSTRENGTLMELVDIR